MKQIIFSIIAIGFLAIGCNQEQDINSKIEATVNKKANRMVDSLKNVCNKNFDTQLQSRVAAAIKSNNQLTTTPKPTVKPKSNTVTKPKTPVTSTTKPQTRGRTGIGKGGGLLKNKPATKTKPPTNTNPSTNTTEPTKTINSRPGVKKEGGK